MQKTQPVHSRADGCAGLPCAPKVTAGPGLRYLSASATHRNPSMRLPAVILLSAVAFVAIAGGPVSYGEAFEDGPAVPVSEAVDRFDELSGQPMRFSGRITEVCQKMGCWMMLEDDGHAVRVKFGDHAFFLPKEQAGTAVVHGVLERKELTPEQVEHFAEDSPTGLAPEIGRASCRERECVGGDERRGEEHR